MQEASENVWCYMCTQFINPIHQRPAFPACSSGDGSSLNAGLNALAQPFKLRLARSEHEKQLKDYSSNVVLIEPLASMTAVEDFLWSKVYRSENSPPPPARPAAATVSTLHSFVCNLGYPL